MKNYLPEETRFLDFDDAWANPELPGVEIISVPYDVTSSYGRGSDKGPAAIIRASRELELYDPVLELEPYKHWDSIVTAEPLNIYAADGTVIGGEELSQRLYESVLDALERFKFVVTLGGEHTSIVGAVKAHVDYFKAQNESFSVLQFDSHSDLREEYQGNRFSHACAMKRILDFHGDIAQLGIRSQIREEREFTDQRRIPVFYAEDIPREDSDAFSRWLTSLSRSLNENIYITFDCDALDPSIMPATGTPEPGGLNWRQINRIFSFLAEKHQIIGLDINELAPIAGINFPEFTMAKLLYRLLGILN